MSERVSVLLICEQPELLTGSGCCRLHARNGAMDLSSIFRDVDDQREKIGLLYRVLRRFFARDLEEKSLAIVCVDPRNQLYLVPKLWRDVWRYRPGWKAGCLAAFQAFALPAVVVNGRPLSRKGEIDPDELCHTIGQLLGNNIGSEEPTHG
ncbi:MAG: hypothetical protein AB7K24_20760 [Gemmataceae bacterium]